MSPAVVRSALLFAALAAAPGCSPWRLVGDPLPGADARANDADGAGPDAPDSAAHDADAGVMDARDDVPTDAVDAGCDPAAEPACAARVEQVSLGAYHTCARTRGGRVYCWGANNEGQLGDGSMLDRPGVVEVRTSAGVPLTGVTSISLGAEFSCALDGASRVYCWGSNSRLQNSGIAESMSRVLYGTEQLGLPADVEQVSAGREFVCARTRPGMVFCWGAAGNGQLGDGSNSGERRTPAPVMGLPSPAAGLWTGMSHACASTTGNGLHCWGDNSAAQVADSTDSRYLLPRPAVGVAGATSAALGSYHSCAIVDSNAVCWGSNVSFEIAAPTIDARGPNRVALADGTVLAPVTAIALGGTNTIFAHSCALSPTGGAWCWGRNNSGQLGTPPAPAECSFGTRCERRATPVPGGFAFRQIALGAEHTCAIADEPPRVYCWGRNNVGQIGRPPGTTPNPTPAPVTIP